MFAWIMELAFDQFEEQYVRTTLSKTLDLMVAERDNAPDWSLPRTDTLRGYVIADGDRGDVPSALVELTQGYFEYEQGDREFEVGVRQDKDVRYVLTFDTTVFDENEERLQRAFIIAVAVVGCMAVALGVWTANRILAPVVSLARQMREVEEKSNSTELEVQWGNDEVGELALAFEHYRRRVQELLHRERDFTANVSHELRTPIMVASSSVELLLARGDLDMSTTQRLQRIARALRQMTNLVDAFLILGRDAQDAPTLDRLIQVEPTVRELVELRRESAQAKKLRLHLSVDGAPRVAAPRTVLAVVLDNLIRNALAYTSAGEIAVCLTERSVRVSDTGPGIPEDEQQKVFEREFRGRGADAGGVGLGLSIVKALCDRYGWQVSIKSKEGEGTTAEVQFASSPMPGA